MAQFSVCRNKNPHTHSADPFLLDAFGALREVAGLRSCLVGRRGEAPQRFRSLRDEGEEKSSRLRALRRSALGHRSEGRGEYGMKLQRSPRRRADAVGERTSPA